MNKVISLLFLFLCIGAGSAPATDLLFDFNPFLNHVGSNAPVGSTSFTVTTNGYSMTAYGCAICYAANTTNQTGLYFVSNGSDLNGLGIAGMIDTSGGHELCLTNFGSANHVASFIQVYTDGLCKNFSNAEMRVQGVDCGEEFDVYGSQTLGSLGTKICSAYGESYDDTFFTIPRAAWTNYDYFGLAVTPQAGLTHKCDTVILDALLVTNAIPEPHTLLLFVGALGLALGWRNIRSYHTT